MSDFVRSPSFIPAIPARVPLLTYQVPTTDVRIYKGGIDERDHGKAIPISAPLDLLNEIATKPPTSPAPAPEAPKEPVPPKLAPVISCQSCADLKRENRLLSKALALTSIKLHAGVSDE